MCTGNVLFETMKALLLKPTEQKKKYLNCLF